EYEKPAPRTIARIPVVHRMIAPLVTASASPPATNQSVTDWGTSAARDTTIATAQITSPARPAGNPTRPVLNTRDAIAPSIQNANQVGQSGFHQVSPMNKSATAAQLSNRRRGSIGSNKAPNTAGANK